MGRSDVAAASRLGGLGVGHRDVEHSTHFPNPWWPGRTSPVLHSRGRRTSQTRMPRPRGHRGAALRRPGLGAHPGILKSLNFTAGREKGQKRSSRTRAVFARRGVCAGAWQGGWVNMGENAGPRPPATAENPQPAGAAHSLRKFWRGKWRDQAQGDQNGRVGVGWRPSHDGAPWEEWCAYVSQRLTPGSPPEVA